MEIFKSPEKKSKAKPESLFRSLGRLAVRLVDGVFDLFLPGASKK
jgi:hypothetical protein